MELPVSSKTATFEKKPRIEKGYYLGQLLEVKPREKQDGTPIEGKYGKQIILMFSVYDKKEKKPIVIAKEQNVTEDLVLPMVLNSEYKDKDGSYRTAVTPNSRITKVFQALGWKFDATKPLNMDDFKGNQVELNIDDYEVTRTDKDGKEEIYKASCIKDLSALEEEGDKAPPNNAQEKYEKSKPQTIKKELKHKEVKKESKSEVKVDYTNENKDKKSKADKIQELEDLNERGLLSDAGLKMAKEQLSKEK